MSVDDEPGTRADKRLHQASSDESAAARRCRCSLATLSGPAGDIVVLRVAGVVDPGNYAVLDAALDDVLDRRPDHLIVDLTGLLFCSALGLSAITRTARAAAAHGVRFSMSGASPVFARQWPRYWPDGDAPRLHGTTAAAVLSAVVLQADRWRPVAGRARPVEPERDPVGVPEGVDDVDPPAPGHHPRPDAHEADPAALRRALHQHRSRIYRTALHALGASYGAPPLGPDLDAQLRIALAGFGAAPPDVRGGA